MSRITELQIENVKRLTAVHIFPGKRALVKIAGDNEQGKSSVLDSIAVALGGAAKSPEEPLHKGTSHAQVILKTEELVISRRYTKASGWSVVVTTPDGKPQKAPQALLDTLASEHTFDPASFLKLKRERQREVLMQLMGLDFTEEDQDRDRLYGERTTKNREVAEAERLVSLLPVYPEAPNAEPSPAELQKELAAAQRVNDEVARQTQAAKRHGDAVKANEAAKAEKVEALRLVALDIARLERRKADLEGEVSSLDQTIKVYVDARTKAERAVGKAVDLAPIGQKFAEMNSVIEQVRANATHKARLKELDFLRREAEEMTASLQAMEKKKADALAAAKFPIKGLSFDDTGVRFEGHPLADASSAQALRVSVAIGCAMNPKLRVMFIRDGSLMDKKAMANLEKLAEEFDVQVWIERVGTDDKTAIVIEDGTNL